ncbi:MAG TPA: hypothetical protein VKS44_08595 [Candidatus Acidoferrales bacterium]|nr:hypothetical protein [Candidatus Acidoferrales bacterium]
MITAALTDFETYCLHLAIPSLCLTELADAATDAQLRERAVAIGYDDEFCQRGEDNLKSLLMLLGVLPSSEEERFLLIHATEGK